MKTRWTPSILFPILLLTGGCAGAPTSAGTTSSLAPTTVTSRVQDPELAANLVKHLRTKYPNLELGLMKTLVSLDAKYPGLVYSLPRHLLEDLGDESMTAVADALDAENAQYPQLRAQLASLRASQGPARVTGEYLAVHYPALRTQLLQAAADGNLAVNGTLRERIRENVRSTVQAQAPRLLAQVALAVSTLADESYPTLAAEAVRERGDGPPMRATLSWLRKNHPDFLVAARRRILSQQGPQIRQAAIAVLSSLEKDPTCQPGRRLGQLGDFLNTTAPTVLPDALDQGMAAGAKFRAAVHTALPDLGPIAMATTATKHPELLSRALTSVQQNYPNLRSDFQAALQAQLPGIRQEARAYLVSNYPDVASKLPPL